MFLTGGAMTSTVEAFLATVPSMRIDRPFDPADLRNAIEAALVRSS